MGNAFRLMLAALCLWPGAALAGPPRPPGPPASGPGSPSYTYPGIATTTLGEGAEAAYIVEPEGAAGKALPTILFLHGWGGVNPGAYGAWIEHIVRRGAIVIYPVYQASLRDPPSGFTPAAIAATKAALARLSEPGHALADPEHFAIVGHSMGGVLSANVAAEAARVGLPKPRAMMSVEPGKTWGLPDRALIELDDLSRLPADLLMLVVVGDKDQLAGDRDGKRIFNSATSLPIADRNYVIIQSDDHGTPALDANHFAPISRSAALAPLPGGTSQRQPKPLVSFLKARLGGLGEGTHFGAPDALDYFGLWKLFDALTDAAFYGANRNYALGNTPEQRFMGVWSDGVPVKELSVTTSP